MKEKIIEFWKEHETKIVFLAGLVLVALISFQGGYLKGKTLPESPLVIEKTTACPESLIVNQPGQSKAETIANSPQTNGLAATENKNCAFVGSKNSNKYHLPACRYAKTIKPENLACFSSKEDAEKKGYTADDVEVAIQFNSNAPLGMRVLFESCNYKLLTVLFYFRLA